MSLLVDLQHNKQPADHDVEKWLHWKDTPEMFVDDVNIDNYGKFVFRYTIPMTRTKIIDKTIAEYRQGSLQFLPDILEKITPSDHAFALLSVMNHYSDWVSKKDAFVSRDTTTMKKVRTKWTQAAARTRINAGWQPAALKVYLQCESFFKEFMASDEWIILRDKVHEMMEKKVEADSETRAARRSIRNKCKEKTESEPVAYEFDESMLDVFENSDNNNESFESDGYGRNCLESIGDDEGDDELEEDDQGSSVEYLAEKNNDEMRVEAI